MQPLKKSPKSKTKSQQSDLEPLTLNDQVMDYLTIGVGCNCLIALFEAGVLETLINPGYVSENALNAYGDPLCLKSALTTLERSQVVKKKGGNFKLTEFGKALVKKIGLFTIFFDGYGELIASQTKIVKKEKVDKHKLMRGVSISKAATFISDQMIDPILLKEILEIKLVGTICDLGCGSATMLSKICQKTKNHGLGFDSEPEVIEQAAKKLQGTNVTVEVGDITELNGVWEDVVMLIQNHVFHDFTPEKRCIDIMNSYLEIFPNMKCFFYIDTVSPATSKDKIFPGFDYVHGLLGIPTRTYEETMQMFSHSKYKVVKEVPIPELPNTFLWVLYPKRGS